MSLKGNIQVFENADALNHHLANFIVELALKAVAERDRFIISLSGGETPIKLYTLLASAPFKEKMPWQKSFFFWGDERCVAKNDVRNNAYIAKVAMLNKVNVPSGNIYEVESELAPDNAAQAYEIKLHDFFEQQLPQFDLMLLGLGEDGHTASLFPDSPSLREKTHWTAAVYSAQQRTFRVTLTLPVINNARQIVFAVTGNKKAEIIQHLKNETSLKYPAQLVSSAHGNLWWYLDKDAASLV